MKRYFSVLKCCHCNVQSPQISQIYLMDHSDTISLKLSEEYYFPKTPIGKIMRLIMLGSKTSPC